MNMLAKKNTIYIIALLMICQIGYAQQNSNVKIALVKYSGGGDWYANPSSLPNLIKYCNENINTEINSNPATVEVGSSEIFNYPLVHLTGHGNVLFTNQDVENLRAYLEGGGFIHIDDNYGLDTYIRREMKKVFPNKDFIEIPYSHAIYHSAYDFENGLPKIHEHDNKPPQGFGIFIEDRLVAFYSYESDLGDGWESRAVHNDPEHIRQKALKMGANIVAFVFNRNKNISNNNN